MLAAEIRAGGGGGDGRAEALPLLGVAEQLLGAGDLARSRAFAERAMEADPLLDGADRVLAAADVLQGAQRRRVNNHVDWYAVLQLDASAAAASASASAVRLQYRRLALLLRPDPHHGNFNLFSSSSSSYAAAADEAFKLVCDAWAVLSDPAKKELYDKEIEIAAAGAQEGPDGGSGGGQNSGESAGKKASVEAEVDAGASFWTACTSCFYVYQYSRGYEGRSLLCHNCGKAFQAMEMGSPPPLVPGKDMYFCAWGLFPLGFPGGPNFVQQLGHDAAGEPWRQSSLFQGFPWQWGAQGPSPMESHVEFGSSGKKKKKSSDVDEDWEPRSAGKKKNQRSAAAKKGKANGRIVNENDVCNKTTGMPKSPRKTRMKVMAKREKKQASSAEECGVVASGEVEVLVDPANKDDGEIKQGAETKPDGMKNPQKAGCSRTVEVSVEDLNLNFAIDVNAAAAIIESMGMSTLTFSKDEDVVVVDQLW